MLGQLLGSVNKERALVYLLARKTGYAREISRFYKSALDPLQKALEGLERAGVIVGRSVGRTREYEFNPRYPARRELYALVERAIELYPIALRDDLKVFRSRPRKNRKPV